MMRRARARLRARDARVARGGRGRASPGRSTPTRSSARGSRRLPPASPPPRRSSSRSRDGIARGVHARGRGRPPRALRRERRPLRRERRRRRSSAASRSRDAEYAGGASRPRELPRRASTSGSASVDLVVTPTLPFVAPPFGDEREHAELADAAHLAVQRARRAGPGAPVRPRRGRPPGIGADRRPAGRRRARARGRRAARARCSSRSAAMPTTWRQPCSCASILLVFACCSPSAQTAAAPAAARSGARSAARRPTGLHAFLLRADEPVAGHVPAHAVLRVVARTTAQRATTSSSRRARRSTTGRSSGRPARARSRSGSRRSTIPIALPWMTGHPYALYARVRAQPRAATTRWSAPFGFNMRWTAAPEQLAPTFPASSAGRRSRARPPTRSGSVDARQDHRTTTNVADEREYYALPPDPPWTGVVQLARPRRPARSTAAGCRTGCRSRPYGPWSARLRLGQPAGVTDRAAAPPGIGVGHDRDRRRCPSRTT